MKYSKESTKAERLAAHQEKMWNKKLRRDKQHQLINEALALITPCHVPLNELQFGRFLWFGSGDSIRSFKLFNLTTRSLHMARPGGIKFT